MFDVKDVILESQYDVLNTLINLINKNELFIESGYINNEAYDDFVNEMFEIYLEATQRNKDQKAIAQYMRDHNLGDVNGKNPSNVKRARKLQNTLLQHDFDPKTETIRSDVNNPDGSAKRVPLRMYNTKTVDSSLDGKKIDNDAHFGRTVNDNQYINIPSNDMKKHSQSDAQFTLHHELGHHKSYNTYASQHKGQTGYTNENLPENDPANVMLTQATQTRSGIKKYPYINNHDRSSEELHADLHGAQNARVRTKHWGNKSSGKNYKQKLNAGTRNVNDNEILEHFKRISRDIRYTKKEVEENLDYYKKAYDQVKNCETKGNINQSDTYVIDFLKLVFENSADTYLNIINNKEGGFSAIDKRYMTVIDDIRQLARERTDLIKWVTRVERMPKDKIESSYVTDDDTNEKIPVLDYIKELKKRISELGKEIENLRTTLNTMKNNVETSVKKAYSLLTKHQQASNPKIGYNNTMLHEWHNLAMKFDLYNTWSSYCSKMKQQYSDIKESLDWILDSSTKMRYDFVMQNKKAVQEYFTDFFNEYYTLELLFE